MWPKYVDMTDNECKLMLRKLELEAYSNVVSALRAQGPLTDEKQGLLVDIASELHIPRERYSAEIRRAVNDEKLSTIALQIYGPNTEIKWAIEGRREIPLIPRLHAQTAYSFLADKIANITATENAKLPFPTKANRKEVKTCKKSDVPESRSAKKSKKESKVSVAETEEEKPKETSVKTDAAKKSDDKTDRPTSVESVSEISTSKTSSVEEISLCERGVDSVSTVKSEESSPVKKRRVIAKTTFSKPVATVVSKNVKNGRTVVTAKAVPSNTRKPTQIISAVKPATSATGAKMVTVSANNPLSTLKVVNKSINSPFSSNSPLPLSTHSSVVTGIKVMTPRSSATAAMPRTPHGTEFPRFIRPNISSVRPNVTNSLAGLKHNVVVMQKNSQAKRGVTISSKDLADKMLKRKPSGSIVPFSSPTVSKLPKFSQEGSQGVPSSQGNIIVVGANQGNSSSLFPESSKFFRETASVTNGANVGSNAKTFTKSKIILPLEIPKPVMSAKVISPSVSSEAKTLLPKMASASASFISESKPSASSNTTKVVKAQPSPAVSDRTLNRILTSSTSVCPVSDSISVSSSTNIIITDTEGNVLGTVPSASIASSQSQLNFLFSMTSANSTTTSKSIIVTSNSVPSNETVNKMKSVVVPSSNKSNFSFASSSNVSTIVPEKSLSRSNIFLSREKLVSSSSVCDRPIVSPKIQSRVSEFVVESEPIVVNVPSTSDIECSSSSFISHCNTSALTEVTEVLVNLNEAEIEEVGVLDPVTGVYSFPFDENESNQDSTVSVNSLPSSTDLTDQLECNVNSQVLSVSPVPESVTDSPLPHIVVEPATAEINTTELSETSVSTGTTNECDISNISVSEVTLEETLECFESAADEIYTEEVADKDPQNIDSVLDDL